MSNNRVIPNNPEFKGLAEMVGDIQFAAPDGHPLTLHLIKPWKQSSPHRYPLVVFIQGSAWTKPNQYWEIPQLSLLARRGFVVATVTHRSCYEAKAPAFLVDVKSAIRYLRANAAEYDIDPDRVCVWGTSSGGNTALLVGMTGDDPAFESDVCPGLSTKVQAVVDCFGPTDLVKMLDDQYADAFDTEEGTLFKALGSGTTRDECRPTMEKISPIRYAQPGRDFPPFLMLHGDADPVVLYEDTERLYRRLTELGYQADLVRVTGAEHEGSFWSEELLEIIFNFIEEKLC